MRVLFDCFMAGLVRALVLRLVVDRGRSSTLHTYCFN